MERHSKSRQHTNALSSAGANLLASVQPSGVDHAEKAPEDDAGSGEENTGGVLGGEDMPASPSLSPTLGNASRFSSLSLEEIRSQLADFAKARSWDQFHTPRNLLIAMVSHR